MDKSEKIARVKELQKEISSYIKAQQFKEALQKINEILAIAPNLQKIIDLKSKVEKKISSDTAVIPVSAKETSSDPAKKETPPAPAAVQTEEKTGDPEAVEAVEQKSQTETAESVAEKEAPDSAPEGPLPVEEKPEGNEKEDGILNVLLKEQEEEKEKEVDAILADLDDEGMDSDDAESGESVQGPAEQDVELTPDALEEKLNALMNKEREKAGKGPVEDLFSQTPPEKKDTTVPQPKPDIDTEEVEREEVPDEVDESGIEALLNEPDDEPEPQPEAVAAEKPPAEKKVPEPTPSLEEPPEEDFSESEIEDMLNGEEQPEPEVAGTEQPVTPVPDEKPAEQEPEHKFKMPQEKDIPDMIGKKPEALKKEPESKEQPLIKSKTDLEKEQNSDFKMPTDISAEGITDKTIKRDGAVPTIISKGKKEDKSFDFSISEEAGIGAQADAKPVYTHTRPQDEATAPDIDSTIGRLKKEGFALKNIPQAVGFVFNMERLLISTIGITLTVIIYYILQKTLPVGVGSAVGFIVYISLITMISAFISFTVVKQINEQIHVRFLHHFSEFNRDMLFPSLTFWIFWLVMILLLGAIIAIITAIGKFGAIGSIAYSLLSPFNFIFAIIMVALVLVSGLVTFILPAIIAVDRPGVFSVLKETMHILKNHLFTIFGGFIFTAVLNFFIMIATMFVLIGTYMLIGMTLMAINPGYAMKLTACLPPMIVNMIPQLQQMSMAGASMMEISWFEKFGFGFFGIFMLIGSVFLISIPFIFQNGAAVITLYTIKGKKDIVKK